MLGNSSHLQSKCKVVNDFNDRLDPVILSALRIKGQVLHHLHAHLKVQGCLSV